MIKAEELRIGNWMKDASGNEFQVSWFHIKMISEWKIYPIPISEESLFKFGFKKHPKAVDDCDDNSKNLEGAIQYENDIESILLSNNGFYFVRAADMHPVYGWNYQVIKLDSIHQLQNIYFALTGKELAA